MSSFIETLNQWGGNFFNFAWPMLWQSSLLIALVFALDFLSARNIRASIRYALWLAVLLKLLLPPTLAMPTSAAWWLFQRKPAIEVPAFNKYVVTYDSSMPQSDFVRQTAAVPAPEPKLDGAGRALLASITMSAGLLLWLMFRWRQVAQKVRDATVDQELAGALEGARKTAGLRSRVRLKMADAPLSPAVCGLINPAILLPRSLVEKLSARQLRAVLLHELFHLRRKDVWVNCAQALLQIVYWWHPLLWLANARLRRVREEAVDDAVMLALRDEAESYAPTLLEVAKLAFARPQLSLGLVGIMESRSALRQRIERLVNFHPPRKAGLTFLSLCGIFVFSAVALPMGEAPAESTNPTLSGLGGDLNQSNLDVSTTNHFLNSTNVFEDKVKANKLVRDAKLVYEMGKFGEAENLLKSALALEPENQAAHYYMNLVQAAKAAQREGIMPTQPGRRWMVDELDRVRFDRFGPNVRWPLNEVVQELNQLTGGLGSNKTGIHFSAAGSSPSGQSVIDPNSGLSLKSADARKVDINSVVVTIDSLNNVTLAEVLNAIVRGADKPIKYSISDEGIVFSPITASDAPRLYSRTFKLNTNVFLVNLRQQVGNETNVTLALSQLFSKAGVKQTPPKAIFYNDRIGLLFVRATEQDLDAIEKIVVRLNNAPPQIHIKARFIELPGSAAADLYLESFNAASIHSTGDDLPQPGRDTLNQHKSMMVLPSGSIPFTGIMTESQFQTALRVLVGCTGVEELAQPEVITTSGRQVEMRSTQIITVITNFSYREISNVSAIFPQTNVVETGPVLDTVAIILADDYTIDLETTASLTEFLGYDQPTNTAVAYNSAGQRIDLPTILPSLCVHRASAHVKLYDDQTVVLGGLKKYFSVGGKSVGVEPDYFVKTKAARGQPDEKDEEVLVFITVTLVDPAGNRIHSDEEMPFAKGAIPHQDGL